MCGIASIVGSGWSADSIQHAIDRIAHRGPDGSGTLVRDWAALGHRRLSIIDVDGGAQPMSNEDGTCHVSFNGEIYNFVELRDQLTAAGHVFRTSSDTEVIVHAYEQWGDDCPGKLRGMFAFAVMDEKRRSVFVARDRIGIKPLYYCALPGRTVLASELSAIEAVVPHPLEIDREAVHAFLRVGYIPAPLTIFEQVRKLPPASSIRVDENGVVSEPQRYWDLSFQPDYGLDVDEWVDRIDETIRDSVRVHLRSDVDFGSFLSGGLDSSLVMSYMAELMDRPVKTFSIGFDEEKFSECHYAEQASKLYKTDHQVSIVHASDIDSIGELAVRYGEPFGDHSALPTMQLCQFASSNVKMVLSGDGGDELFGGYERYLRAASIWSPPKRGIGRQAIDFVRGTARRTLGRSGYVPPTPFEHWNNNARMFTFQELQAIVGGDVGCDPIENLVSMRGRNAKDWHYLSQLQYADIHCYLQGDILPKVDIASMRHGLEVRVPLLDHKVAELAACVPPEFLVTRNQQGEYVGKSILKKLAERRFPKEFVYRKKQGFGIPIAQWINRIPKRELHDRLNGKDSRLAEFLNPSSIGELIDGEGIVMRTRKIWLLMVLSSWLDRRTAVEPTTIQI